MAEPILGSCLLQQGHHLVAVSFPELIPFPYPAGLLLSRAYKRSHVSIALCRSFPMQAVQPSGHLLPLSQGLVPSLALRYQIYIFRLVDSSQLLKLLQQSLLFIGHVVDIVHVRIERRAQAEITEHYRQGNDYPQ